MCVHGNNARNLSVQLSLTQLAKTLCLPYYAYVFSSTKLEIRADRFCLEVRGEGRRGCGKGTWGRNDPNNVCTCE
jgi:hypothetical protein